MARDRVRIQVDNMRFDLSRVVEGGDLISFHLHSDGLVAGIITRDYAGLLDLWVELGAFMDRVVPGATGLRPLPEGDPAQGAADEIQAEVASRRAKRGTK